MKINFGFSFLSGSLGFLCSFLIAYLFEMDITTFLLPFVVYISATIGFLTFLIGLILHQFISMKYKNENIRRLMMEGRLKSLENELNPHFLFNALNSVSELIYCEPKKAENAVLEISQFLRNAITKESVISISEELSMVNTYINIENIRFQNKIKLTIKGDETSTLIPKFSIQLLVENAIKHGFTGNNLDINIEISDRDIVVQNNGKIPKSINCGIGLNNLKNRLKLLDVGILTHRVKSDNLQFTITFKE
jgi:LytS/YehU family sensor histidine kinase